MKRITTAQQVRQLRAADRRWRIRLRRKGRSQSTQDDLQIFPPAELSFRDNFGPTMRFFDELRDATTGDGSRRVFVDLAPIDKISVPAAIVLAAEFHRWSLLRRGKLRPRKSHTWSPRVRSLLADLGVFSLLGLQLDADRPSMGENVTLTPLRSGELFDGKAIDRLQAAFARIVAGFTTKPEVYAGLAEAAENAIAHAYPDGYQPKHRFAGHRWWGASCLDTSQMRLRFFIFDQGAGIPYTVPSVSWIDDIRNFLAQAGLLSDDAHMLRAAFEVGRTRTGLANRGLGLSRMADVVRGSKSAYLRILSGQAEMVYRHDDRIETRGLTSHVGGTLIEWNMPSDVFLSDKRSGGDHAND